MRQRHSPYSEDRLGNCGNTALPLDSEGGDQDLTDGRKERVRSLLTEAVTLLCKNSVFYQTELMIEGLLGVTVDTKDVFLVNINQKVNNHSHCSTAVPDHRVCDDDEYDDVESCNRSMHQSSPARVESSETLSPSHPKRHKRKTKHQTVISTSQDSPQHISSAVECPDSMIDRKTADYQTDIPFDTKTSDIVVIKSEPGDEDNDNLDYTENVYEDAGHQTGGRNNEYSVDSNIEQTGGPSDTSRSDYHTTAGSTHSCSSSPGHLPTNICNWSYPVDSTCEQDGSVTHLSHNDNDRPFEPYIAHSAIFPIATSLPSRLGKVEADSELTIVSSNQLSIQTPTQQSMLFPTGGVDASYSPTSSKGSDQNVTNTSMLWNELQQRPNGHPSDNGDYPIITDQSDGRMGTGNMFTEIRGSTDMLNSGVASNPDGQSTICKVCGKMLASRTVYSRHLKTHLGRYFTCQICSRQFNRKDNLKRHYALLHQAPAGSGSTSNTDNEQTVGQTENSNQTEVVL